MLRKVFVEKEGHLTLIWTTDEKTFHSTGEIERYEIVNIAESLNFIQNSVTNPPFHSLLNMKTS